MKREELSEMTLQELESRLSDDYDEMENLRFQKALQQLENPLRLRHLRREIAQIKTALTEYELGIRKAEG